MRNDVGTECGQSPHVIGVNRVAHARAGQVDTM